VTYIVLLFVVLHYFTLCLGVCVCMDSC